MLIDGPMPSYTHPITKGEIRRIRSYKRKRKLEKRGSLVTWNGELKSWLWWV